MSTTALDTRKLLANPTTEVVLVKDLRPGDLFFLPASVDPDPWRVRYVDRFPGTAVNIFATPGALLQRCTAQSVGVWDGTVQTVKRVVLT